MEREINKNTAPIASIRLITHLTRDTSSAAMIRRQVFWTQEPRSILK